MTLRLVRQLSTDERNRWKRIRTLNPARSTTRVSRAARSSTIRRSLSDLALLLELFGTARQRAGEMCVCDLGDILGVTQSAVSQHLAKLRAYGMVTARRDAQTLYYALADKPEVKMLRKVALAGIEVENERE